MTRPVLPAAAFFEHDGDVYVFGMRWFTEPSKLDLDQNADVHAAKIGGTHVAIRANALQYGVANAAAARSSTPWKRRRSMAAALADANAATWIGLYPLDNGRFWLCAVSRGRMMPDGDIVCASATDARERFDKVFPTATWQTIYAPKIFEIENSIQQDLRAALQHRHKASGKGAILRAVKRVRQATRRRFPLVGSVIVASCVSLGAMLLLAPSLLKVLHHRKPAVVPAAEAPAPKGPLYPSFRQSLARCAQALPAASKFIAAPGWRVVDARCDSQAVTITLQALDVTPLTTIKPIFPNAAIQGGKRQAAITLPFSQTLPKDGLVEPIKTRATLDDLIGPTQEDAEAQSTFLPVTTALPGAVEVGTTRPVKWVFTTDAPIDVWLVDLIKLPNIALDAVSYSATAAAAHWIVEGTAYVAP